MSRKRRNYSPEFKTKIVLEVIRGEKKLNEIASEHSIQPNLIRNWKKEFLANASSVFDPNADDSLKEEVDELESENDELAKKVGRLTVEVDWLKKKSKELIGSDYESKFSKKPKGK